MSYQQYTRPQAWRKTLMSAATIYPAPRRAMTREEWLCAMFEALMGGSAPKNG